MKTNTKERIINFLKKEKKTVLDISNKLLISNQMTHRHLKKMIEDGVIEKEGSAPKVFYKLKNNNNIFLIDDYIFTEKEKEVLKENFLYITPIGKRLEGKNAFMLWCNERGFNVKDKIKEYLEVLNKYKNMRKDSFYDATSKIKNSFNKVCVDKLLYIDFNSVEVFGKTKLGQMVLYAKQNQDRKEMREISNIIREKINILVKEERIDSVVYIPPTVKREYQFMKFLEKELDVHLPIIKVIKKKNDIAVPQKTLKKITDRQKNAEATFEVIEKLKYKKTLIIDDAVGSGSTINEVACKIKDKGLTKEIIGISLVGSLNGFEVISEV